MLEGLFTAPVNLCHFFSHSLDIKVTAKQEKVCSGEFHRMAASDNRKQTELLLHDLEVLWLFIF